MAKREKVVRDADAPEKRRKRTKHDHSSRNLAVEHMAYNLGNGDYQTCPFIRLKGHWLARAGFTIGSRVTVAVRRGCLTIRVVK